MEQVLGFIRRKLLGYVLRGIAKAVTVIASELSLKTRLCAFGNDLGQQLGRLIPGNLAEPFIAAFARGFSKGMEDTDGPPIKVETKHVDDPATANLGNSEAPSTVGSK